MGNHLAEETSAYLRQHADQPVEWYPWGDEALTLARASDRPLFISIGYSTCHWCHVMAHESFDDPDVAAVMNRLFVNVKVDREERPDLDAIYLEATQAISGRGGWPMSVFATPDGRPFFAGTYFPAEVEPGSGQTSFLELCRSIGELWQTQRADIDAQAGEVTEVIGRLARVAPSVELPGPEVLDLAASALVDRFDPEWGGFGLAPKFPEASAIEFLLRRWRRTGDPRVGEVVTTSLDAMASGGIHDHIGGGFARYSTDRQWLVPHFEKLLCDQALLVRCYLHAWQLTGHARYLGVVADTIDGVLHDFGLPDGGFAAAIDADAEGVEGAHIHWEADEVRSVLTRGGLDPMELDAVLAWWGITDDGNSGDAIIPWRPRRGDLVRPPVVDRARRLLAAARVDRPQPQRDDKVLTEWNALWVTALAEAAAATANPAWAAAAVRCGRFLADALRREDGRWLRSWDGTARQLACASDYAALVDAYLALGSLTGDGGWVALAQSVADGLLTLFWDGEHGGLFTTGVDAPPLVTPHKDLADGAVPSANSLAAVALARLAATTGIDGYRRASVDICRLMGELLERHPAAFTHGLWALELHGFGVSELVVSGRRPDLLATARARFLPDVVLVWGEPWATPLWEGRTGDDPGRAYLCRNQACDAPVGDPAALSAALDALIG